MSSGSAAARVLRPGLLLDVDGTLLDSTYHHALAWLRAFRELGCPTTAAQTHRAIGLGDDQLVPHLLGLDPDDVPDGLLDSLADAHSHHYAPLRDEVVALPGAAELVIACADRGVRAVLATSGKAADLDWMVPRIGDGVTDALFGHTTSEDVSTSKPAPYLIQVALDAHGLDAAHSVVVGDSTWDAEAAGRAGVVFVGVLTGGFSADELRAAGAIEVHQDLAALLDAADSVVLRLMADTETPRG